MIEGDRSLAGVDVLGAEGGDGLGGRLADLGCVVLPPALSAADALALLATFRPDAALLGARLPGGPAAVAHALDAAGVPCALVVTPDDPEPDHPALGGVPRLGGFAGPAELRHALLRLVGRRRAGA